MATSRLRQVILMACVLPLCGATVRFYFHAKTFTSGCKEALSNKCDFMFTFCFDRPESFPSLSNCHYYKTEESQNWSGDLDINFDEDSKGLPNPMVFTLDGFEEKKLRLLVRLRDKDPYGARVDITTMYKTISFTPAPSYTTARYTSGSLDKFDSNNRWSGYHTLNYEYKAFCSDYYYGEDCTVRCQATPGRYTCASDGQKICVAGWQGIDCDEDVNECQTTPDVCSPSSTTHFSPTTTSAPTFPRHVCINTIGSYSCVCAAGWKGSNCDQDVDECEEVASLPCLNGGNCSNTLGSYRCVCPSDWNGPVCENASNQTALKQDAEQKEDGFLWWPIVVAVAAVAVIAAVVVVVISIRRQRKRQSYTNRRPGVQQVGFKAKKTASGLATACPKERPPATPPPNRGLGLSNPTPTPTTTTTTTTVSHADPAERKASDVYIELDSTANTAAADGKGSAYPRKGSSGYEEPQIIRGLIQGKGSGEPKGLYCYMDVLAAQGDDHHPIRFPRQESGSAGSSPSEPAGVSTIA